MMASSEGVKRLMALVVVAAGVAAQSSVTRGVVPDQRAGTSDFGVRLLETELAPPALPATTLNDTAFGMSPVFASRTSASAATLPAPSAKPPKPLSQQRLMALPWTDSATAPATDHLEPFPNRDSVGALMRLTQNDVLLLTRQAFPQPKAGYQAIPVATTTGAL